jgi:hypothetical protein
MPPTRNPFNLLAYLLFRVRRGLEDIEQAGQPPRWLRMARLGPQVTAPNPPVMANGVASVVKAFTTSLNWMAEATLDLRELLITTDAAKATAEAALRLLRTSNSPEFVNGLKNILPASAVAELQSIAQSVDGVLGDIENILTYIPEPDDVNRMAHELYRLLCIVQRPVPYAADGVSFDLTEIRPDTQDHVDVGNTGKIRLINWALDAKTTTRGLGDNEDQSYDLYRLGTRRLWEATEANLPQRSIGLFNFGARAEHIFNFDYDHTITQIPANKPHQGTRQDIVELWDSPRQARLPRRRITEGQPALARSDDGELHPRPHRPRSQVPGDEQPARHRLARQRHAEPPDAPRLWREDPHPRHPLHPGA